MPTPMDESSFVTVEIYGQTYHLAGDNLDRVRQLAARVDEQMRAVAQQGRTVDSLRVAVLAALNLADTLARAEDRLAALQSSATQSGDPAHTAISFEARELEARARRLADALDRVLAAS